MIKFFLYLVFFLGFTTYAQDTPKNIISNDNNTFFIEEDNKIKQEKDNSFKEENLPSELNNFTEPDIVYEESTKVPEDR